MPTTYPALHHDFLSHQCCATLLRIPGEKAAGLLSGHVAPSCYLFFFAANWRWLAALMLVNTFAVVRVQCSRLTKTHGAHTRDACLRESGQHLLQCGTTSFFEIYSLPSPESSTRTKLTSLVASMQICSVVPAAVSVRTQDGHGSNHILLSCATAGNMQEFEPVRSNVQPACKETACKKVGIVRSALTC